MSKNQLPVTSSDLPEALVESLRSVILYCWDDERKDYTNQDEVERSFHVFVDLVRLDNFVNGTNFRPENHLEVDDEERLPSEGEGTPDTRPDT